MQRYSFSNLVGHALWDNKRWSKSWTEQPPKKKYDFVIVGGGAHGLATAYYLAKEFSSKSVAVLEKGWIGGGNSGRNTTIIRSNYGLDGNIPFYEQALRLWERMESELNFNVMVSQRGVLNLFHTDSQRDAFVRRGNSMRLHGVDAELLDREAVRRKIPILDFEGARFPILGALAQWRGGTVRHDAVVWAYARAASNLGVDIVQNCEVTGFTQGRDGKLTGVSTTRGEIACRKCGLAVAGNSSRLAGLAGFRLPIESHVLQAFVTEPLKPLLDVVVTFGAGHFYVSQSDKGGLVFGGDPDGYNSYAQRGSYSTMRDVCQAGVALIPCLARARILRSWGGTVDMSMDGSPIIDALPVPGLYLTGGWCYGGFKASPASGRYFAQLLATGTRSPEIDGFRLSRFERGYLLDEKGQGAHPNLH